MRTLSSWLALAAMVALAGCSKPATSSRASVAEDSAPQQAAAKPAVGPQVAPDPALPQLAYTYAATVQAPRGAVPVLLARHEAACARAGAAACQVIGAERTTSGNDVTGQLKLRAQPAWLQAFRAGLAADVRGQGGRVVATSTASEDLTREIVDTDAAVRAKTALAQRLQQLLATHQGRLQDLVETEKALAQVQGELDATRSELAVMRARVATSELTVSYTSQRAFAGAWGPVGEAVHGSVGVFAQAVAALILLVATLLPFALVAAVVALVWRALAQRRRAERPPRA